MGAAEADLLRCPESIIKKDATRDPNCKKKEKKIVSFPSNLEMEESDLLFWSSGVSAKEGRPGCKGGQGKVALYHTQCLSQQGEQSLLARVSLCR